LVDTFPTLAITDDTPTMPTAEAWEQIDRSLHERWGRDFDDDAWGGPPAPRDAREREWFNRYCRSSVAPGGLIAEGRRLTEMDARSALDTIQARTLVVGFESGQGVVDPRIARRLAERIPNATLALIGHEHDPSALGWWHWYGRADAILKGIDDLIGVVPAHDVVFDRALATVLFTDIVDSTERAVAIGDRAWKDLLEGHHRIVRHHLAAFRGVEVDTAGDGFYATFDGPARAVMCAVALAEAVPSLGLEIRAGVHTGEVETIAGKAGGMAVVIGARVCGKAGPSEVLVSQTVKDLTAGSGPIFQDADMQDLKGVPDPVHLWRALSPTR
jgi:class 3 adenylate cyclase